MNRLRTRTAGTTARVPFRDIAHRGESENFPENTIPAYSSADILDPQKFNRWCEGDGRKTSDGVWVLMHDATVNRTTDGTGNVADKTLAEVKELDAGTWKDVSFADTRVPTWQEIAEHCFANKLRFYLETKIRVTSSDVENIINIWLTAGNELRNLSLSSFDTNDLTAMRAANADIEIGYLTSGVAASTINSVLTSVGGRVHSFINQGDASSAFIGSINYSVDVYTPTTTTTKNNLISWGARGLTSDFFISV